MKRLAIAIAAGLVLGAADFFLIASAFLYNPRPANWLILAMLATFAAAVALRRRLLVFAAQNMVSVLAITRVAQSRDPPDLQAVILIAVVIGVGNALAWCMARAIRRPDREPA